MQFQTQQRTGVLSCDVTLLQRNFDLQDGGIAMPSLSPRVFAEHGVSCENSEYYAVQQRLELGPMLPKLIKYIVYCITLIIIIIIITISINEFDLSGTVAMLLWDHRAMLPRSVYTREKWLWKQETVKFRPERDNWWSSLLIGSPIMYPSPSVPPKCTHGLGYACQSINQSLFYRARKSYPDSWPT